MRVFVLVLLAGLYGCKEQEKSAGKAVRVATFSEKEAERGRQACQSYAKRVCACAEDGGSEKCDLAKGRPEALELALRSVAAATHRSDADRWAMDQNARKIIKECLEADLELDPQQCPRLVPVAR